MERKIREQAALGLDPEDRVLLDQLSRMDFGGEQGKLVFGDGATPQ